MWDNGEPYEELPGLERDDTSGEGGGDTAGGLLHETVMTSPTVDQVGTVELDSFRDRRPSRPSKRGTWHKGVLCAEGGVAVDSFFICSECGGGVSCIFSRDKQFKFCPWCGAEMEEVTPEDFLY